MKLYACLIQGVVVLLAVAFVLGAVWALLEPALLPLTLLALLITILMVVYRRR